MGSIKNSPEIQAIAFIITFLFFLCSVGSIPFTRADGSGEERVPKPEVSENHKYNEAGEGGGVKWVRNEDWSISILQGNVITGISVMNLTQKGYMQDDTWISYQFNVQYNVGKSVYGAQCTIGMICFIIANTTLFANLTGCEDFTLARSPVVYNGTVPEFYCNITFSRIRISQGAAPRSTFDLTLIHFIRSNWTKGDTKIEAIFNFSNTQFFNPGGSEYPKGEPFVAELHYTMEAWNMTDQQNLQPLMPTGYGNETMNYDIDLGNGTLLTVSRLKMSNNFTEYGMTGTYRRVGYSTFRYNWRSEVIHGFPNLTYKDTKSIRSDPEITVFHDRMTVHFGQIGPDRALIAGVCAIIGILVAAVLFTFRRHRKKKRGV